MSRRPRAQGFILAWSLLLSLLLGSWVWLSSLGGSLALRSGVNQTQHQQVTALAQLTMAQALAQWPAQQTLLWQQVDGQWSQYQALFTPNCLGGRCDARFVVPPIGTQGLLSGAATDTALTHQGTLGQRVWRRPRYVWALLGRLPDGRLSYELTVRAWGLDNRTVVTLTESWLWLPPQPLEP